MVKASEFVTAIATYPELDNMSKLDENYETDMGKNEIKARMDILKTVFASIIGVLLIVVWGIFKESPDGLLRFSGNVLMSILLCGMALWGVRQYIILRARQLDKKEEEHSSLKSK